MTLPAEPTAPNRDRLWFALGAAALVVGIFLAYLPAVHGGPVWDDDYMLTGNPVMTEAHGLWRIWFDLSAVQVYYPLTLSAMWLESRAFGLHDLTGYHVVNTLLHATDAILLWRLLRRLEVGGAFVVAAVWGLHPVGVESVGWVTEQKNTLSGLLYLLAMGALLRFYRVIGPADRRGLWYLGALVLFALALAAKTTAVTLPAAALLIVWWKRGQIRGGDVWAAVPFLGVAAVAGQVTQWVETHVTGTWRDEWSLTHPQQVLVAGRALWFYAAKLAWPARLSFAYPRWTVDPAIAWQWLYPAAAAGAVAGLWFARKRIGRGPLAGALFFAGTLVPALGFFHVLYQRFTFVSDHFQYLAGVGLIAVVVGGAADLRIARPLKIIVAVVVCLGLGTWTSVSSRRFASDAAVWRAAIEVDPGNPSANLNYAADLIQAGRVDEATPALKVVSDSGQMMGRVWDNLGGIAEVRAKANGPDRLQQYARAEFCYAQAVAIDPDDPLARYHYGTVLMVKSEFTAAAVQLERAVLLRPDWAGARDAYGACLLKLNRPAEAMAQFQRAGEIDPSLPLLRKHLAEAAASPDHSPAAPPRVPPDGGTRGGAAGL